MKTGTATISQLRALQAVHFKALPQKGRTESEEGCTAPFQDAAAATLSGLRGGRTWLPSAPTCKSTLQGASQVASLRCG